MSNKRINRRREKKGMQEEFKTHIAEYEQLRSKYEKAVVSPMDKEEYFRYNEVLFSAHSCAIEGNSFSVDDTRELKEKGLGMIPKDKSLLEAFEMLDHFMAFEYVMKCAGTKETLCEKLLKETNRLCTLHTLGYKAEGLVPGEYTDTDMAAGSTIFGDHNELVKRVPFLLKSTEDALHKGIHPMIVAARFHGFFEYLHPFRDGNGRTGRLISNFILARAGYPLVIIKRDRRQDYIDALRLIRTEATDRYLVEFFFNTAINNMKTAIEQKTEGTRRFVKGFVF